MSNNLLITKNASIPLNFKPNFTSQRYIVPPRSKQIVKLPVDVETGDIYIKSIKVTPELIISEGLYAALDWHAMIEIANTSNLEQSLFLEHPLRAECLSRNYEQINNLNVNYEAENWNSSMSKDIIELLRTSHLNPEEKKELFKVCREYDDIFHREDQNLSFTNQVKHRIRVVDDTPIYTKSYRYPFVHKQEVRKQISSMLEQGIIRPSYSPWSSPVWIVPKKSDASGKKKWRLVIDYRKLNDKTISDRYPLPNINDILDKLGKSMYFSTLDLASGFHQIEMDPQDIPKTAFTVEGGHYEYVRMPFGLKNAPSTFQRVMDNVLKELQGTICLVYLDDIIIFSTSLQEHIENLKKVFHKLRTANLKVQLDKSEFLKKEIAFLGHLVTTNGIRPNPDKVQAIMNFPIPRTTKEIKSFLGLLGYYRKFIKDFAKLTKPLTECLKKGRIIELNNRYLAAFKCCKDILMNDPLLQHPDFSKPFVLTTDASNYAIGAILSQGPIGSDKPICYASRTLTDSEINYSTIEKEFLAIVWATKYFRPYLFGRKFKIVTDHKPLTWMMSLKDPNSRLIRWRLKLEEYDYEVVYKKGTQNSNADALSRIKLPQNKVEININENIDNANESLQGTRGTTVHSAEENLDTGIPISEQPLNEFSLQLVLETSNRRSQTTLKMPFRNKQRRTIRMQEFTEPTIIEIFKKFIPPNRLTAILSSDETFRIIQEVYSKHFSHSSNFKLVRCMELLDEIAESDEQDTLIRNYHTKNNHRGINETLAHLKRECYFPYMKSKITQVINNCEQCQTLKYDRNPQKPKFQFSEAPKKPLETLHIDIYTIDKKYVLTLIDKFSKFAAAYMLVARNSLAIIKSLRHFISLHGVPENIITFVTDQGTEFTSSIFTEFCKQYDINHHITSFQQTSSNAPVERLNSTITETYRIIYHNHRDKDPEDILNEVITTYNNAIHSSTKYTPFELFYGRTYKFNKNIKHNNLHEYLERLREFRDKLYPEIKTKLEEVSRKKLEKLNMNRNDPETVNEGSIIYRRECRRNKLTRRFSRQKVKKDNHITILTNNNKKTHKAKIKKRRKFQATSCNTRTENRLAGPDQ